MFTKKAISVVALILLVGVAVVLGASQLIGRQANAGTGAGSSQDLPAAHTEETNSPNDGAATQGQNGNPGSAITRAAPDLPAATGSVVFSADFSKPDRGMPQGWHQLTDVSSTWLVVQGRLEQRGDADQQPTEDNTALVTDASNFGDGIYEAEVYPMGGEPVGLVFRGSDAGYYRLTLRPNLPDNRPKALLERVAADGRSTLLGTIGAGLRARPTWQGYAYNQWQRMEVQVVGTHITASVDGTPLLDANDSGSALNTGWLGVWTVTDRGSAFDNVRVQTANGER